MQRCSLKGYLSILLFNFCPINQIHLRIVDQSLHVCARFTQTAMDIRQASLQVLQFFRKVIAVITN